MPPFRPLLALFALPFALATCHPPAAVQPNAPVAAIAPDSLARSALADLAEVAPGIVRDLRYATSDNFTGAPLPGYGKPVALMRREAAVALARVQRRLEADGYTLHVWDAYRPVRATLAMVAWTERERRTDLLDDGYIARRSRHNQGVAVDLTVAHRGSGQLLDMGTPFDEFSERSHTANATGVVAANRQILLRAMAAEGFTNYASEWWHYTFDVPAPVPFDLPLEAWIP